jgi:hypothetical protein
LLTIRTRLCESEFERCHAGRNIARAVREWARGVSRGAGKKIQPLCGSGEIFKNSGGKFSPIYLPPSSRPYDARQSGHGEA